MWIVELFKNKKGKWLHRLKSGNGLIIYSANNKGYKRKQGAEKTAHKIARCMRNCRFEDCGH